MRNTPKLTSGLDGPLPVWCGTAADTGSRLDSRASGARIRALRRWAGWSQRALAARLGVTRQTVSRWENQRSRMPYPAWWFSCLIGGWPLPGGAWSGWLLRGDALVSPAGQSFRAHELAWITLVFAKSRAFDRLNASPAERGCR